MFPSGSFASAAEHAVFEYLQKRVRRFCSTADRRGKRTRIPVLAIDAANAATLPPQLQVSGTVLDDVRNAVSQGRQVLIPREEINYAAAPRKEARYSIFCPT